VLVRLAMALAIAVPLFPLYWMVISSLKDPGALQQVPPSWFPADPTFGAFKTVFEVIPSHTHS
jgi:multiple sugar transport system permease protein